jgi:hypothetical protein
LGCRFFDRGDGGQINVSRCARLGGRLRGRCGDILTSQAVLLEGFTKLSGYGRFNRRCRRLDELANSAEFLDDLLAVDAVFCGNLVHAWFSSHNSPVRDVPPKQGTPLLRNGTHFEPLISGPSAFNLFML